jgi:hypothetical protein
MKRKLFKLSIIFIVFNILILIPGCVSPEKPQMTSLQLQSMQARTFDTTKRLAFDSTVTVFQDMGYIISSANFDTGFLTAESPTKTDFSFLDGGRVIKRTKATAFVRQLANGKAKIRLNFVNHKEVPMKDGQKIVQDEAVETPVIYQNAFNKIRECLFVTQNLSS